MAAAGGSTAANQDIDGDGSPSTAGRRTLVPHRLQLTAWNESYKSNTDNANVVAYGFVIAHACRTTPRWAKSRAPASYVLPTVRLRSRPPQPKNGLRVQ